MEEEAGEGEVRTLINSDLQLMVHLPTYGDSRNLSYCAFCGGDTGTRDHCPSRVLLDEPYPENLPVVPACSRCNSSFSANEAYLACLISCVIAGSTDPDKIIRPKIRRLLSESPNLRIRIEQSRKLVGDKVVFSPEDNRVATVLTKLAQGHVLYELHEPRTEQPDSVQFMPISLMSADEREAFEHPQPSAIWPEVGSRAMQRLVMADSLPSSPWLSVQEDLYRYHVSCDPGSTVRIVIQEYLACLVHWD